MKRSEMIKIMQDEIMDQYGHLIIDADTLLAKMEENGVMPPWSKEDRMCFCSSRGRCPGCSLTLYTSKWEQE